MPPPPLCKCRCGAAWQHVLVTWRLRCPGLHLPYGLSIKLPSLSTGPGAPATLAPHTQGPPSPPLFGFAVSLQGPGQSPVFPSRATSGQCFLTAAAAGVPCGVVAASAEPSSWRTGGVLVVAGVVLRFLLPTPLSILVIHHMPRCVSVRVRPNCTTPPRVVQVVRHLHPRAAMCTSPTYSISVCGAHWHLRTFMVSVAPGQDGREGQRQWSRGGVW